MDKTYMIEYASLEINHWWFRARMEILSKIVESKIPHRNKNIRILNVGVASGQTSKMLEKFGTVTSLEFDEDCCHYLTQVAKIDVIQGSLTDLPFDNDTFDLVCAFDVIEHIDDHDSAINEIKRVLKKDGRAFITVPAYQLLWSAHDVINHHFRRYNKRELKNLIGHKLSVDYISYFNFFLFIPIALVRIISNRLNSSTPIGERNPDYEFQKNNTFLNTLFFKIFRMERKMLPQFRFPFGVSLLAVCSKTG